MKRTLAMLMALVLVLGLLPVSAAATEIASGTCGDNLRWVLTEDGTLTISGIGYMDDFFLEEENLLYGPWVGLRDQIRSVVAKPGVHSIGSGAFYECPNLTSVSLPQGLLSIDDYAFAYCEALPALSIPDGVLTIGKEALYNCYSLTELTVPDSVTAIGDYAFMGCLALTTMNIPDGLSRIGNYVYACCGLTSAVIPEGVTEIGEHAFWGCEQMEQLTIPNTVTRIGSNAFRACVGLTSVNIPDSVELIESEAFAICEGLEEINLGNRVASIGTQAFYDCVALKSVTFPASLTYLADHAFEWCLSLETVTFLGSAPEVGEEPLMPYKFITIFYPADDPTWTDAQMQKYGENKSWFAQGAAGEIASGTCGDNLTWVLTEDGTLTISGTGAMYDYEYGGAPWYALRNHIIAVVVSDGATRIGSCAFQDLNKMESAVLSDTVTEIGKCAFWYAEALAAIILPYQLESIGQEAFGFCSSLEKIDLPGTLTFIDGYAFEDCTALTDVLFQSDPDIPFLGLGSALFLGCTALEEIRVEEGHVTLKAIDGVLYTYSGNGLELEQYPLAHRASAFNIPEGTWYIGPMSFNGALWLEKVVIPASMEMIAAYAFADCENLETVRFEGDAPDMWQEMFSSVTATAYYPDGNETWTEDVMQDYGGDITWVAQRTNYVRFSTYTTSLGGNIAMNFYVELSKDLLEDPNAYMQFTFAGRTVKVPLSEGKEDVKNGVTVYMYACPITSKNMSDEITAQVVNASGNVGESKTMAVDTYCNWIIANYSDQKTIDLMKAMLNYGASAQILFNYNTNDLANASLSEADKVLTRVDASDFLHSRTGEEDGIKASSYTLLLDSETTVRCYFELTGNKTIDQFTFTVDGVEVQPQYKDGRYYIEKKNIAAHRLDDMHVFTCGGIEIRYGGLSYVNQVMTYYTEGATFDMAVALYNYSQASEAYIA